MVVLIGALLVARLVNVLDSHGFGERIKNLLLQSALSHECYNITSTIVHIQEHEYTGMMMSCLMLNV